MRCDKALAVSYLVSPGVSWCLLVSPCVSSLGLVSVLHLSSPWDHQTHSSPNSLQSRFYNLCSYPHTLHFTLNILHSSLYPQQSTLYIL